MSRIAAVAARVEEIVAAIVPETRTQAGAGKFVRSDRPLSMDAAPRSFFLESTGDLVWSGELAQDREGSILGEALDLTIAYRAGENHREIRDIIRQDAIRIAYELLDPAKWADADNQWRCQRRQIGAVSIQRQGDGAGAPIVVTIPITLTYRPF